MEVIGWFMAVLIGLVLGLLGGGGSVLTVPVLVYLVGIEPVVATGYSLFVVGVASGFGAVGYYRNGLVDLRSALVFGAPAVVGVYVARMHIVPILPEYLLVIGELVVTRNMGIMLLFALLMLAASITMIKPMKETQGHMERRFHYPLILLEGTVVGILTGLVGAGGGFLIIPALVILSRLPMKRAVGTSLIIITLKSLIGFSGDVQNYSVDWMFLLLFTGLAVVGIFAGTKLSSVIPGTRLKPVFGWFILIMSMYILAKELLF